MAAMKPRYNKEEFAKRGDAIFEMDIRPNLKNEDNNDFVAVDIETGAYEINVSEITACDHLATPPGCPDLASQGWITICASLRRARGDQRINDSWLR